MSTNLDKQEMKYLHEAVDLAVEKLSPISTEMARLMNDPAEIDRTLGEGAARARAICNLTRRKN